MASAEDAFLGVDKAFALRVEQPSATDAALRLHWEIAPGYYLYKDRISVAASASGSQVVLDRPAGERKEDPNFGVIDVYRHAVTLAVDAPKEKELTVTWQGCADAGLCYPPQTQKVVVDTPALATDVAATAHPQTFPMAKRSLFASSGASDSSIQQMLDEHTLTWTLPLFFLLGIALAFTPCVLPMVPIVSSIVVGNQAPPLRALALSLAFVLPMALTYALLGAVAAMMGANVQALLQNPWTVTVFSVIFAALSAAMFGFFTLQLPSFVRDRLTGASQRTQGASLLGAATLGLLSALLVGPCITAPLAATLLYIAQTGHVVSGALLLFALGLGMGVPLIIISTVGARFLPKPGPWMERVKGAFGFLLLGTAILMFGRVLPAPLELALWGTLLAGVALALLHLADQIGTGARLFARNMAFVASIWAGAMLVGAAAGGSDPFRPLDFISASRAAAPNALRDSASPGLLFETVDDPQMLQARLDVARKAGQSVLLDYTADWCISCKIIDREVFSDPQVRHALSDMVLLRADVTRSELGQLALMRQHQVIGPPTVMLFDTTGAELRDARLVGEFGVSDLLQRLLAGNPSMVTKVQR